MIARANVIYLRVSGALSAMLNAFITRPDEAEAELRRYLQQVWQYFIDTNLSLTVEIIGRLRQFVCDSGPVVIIGRGTLPQRYVTDAAPTSYLRR